MTRRRGRARRRRPRRATGYPDARPARARRRSEHLVFGFLGDPFERPGPAVDVLQPLEVRDLLGVHGLARRVGSPGGHRRSVDPSRRRSSTRFRRAARELSEAAVENVARSRPVGSTSSSPVSRVVRGRTVRLYGICSVINTCYYAIADTAGVMDSGDLCGSTLPMSSVRGKTDRTIFDSGGYLRGRESCRFIHRVVTRSICEPVRLTKDAGVL